jgi:hypothetical protein
VDPFVRGAIVRALHLFSRCLAVDRCLIVQEIPSKRPFSTQWLAPFSVVGVEHSLLPSTGTVHGRLANLVQVPASALPQFYRLGH